MASDQTPSSPQAEIKIPISQAPPAKPIAGPSPQQESSHKTRQPQKHWPNRPHSPKDRKLPTKRPSWPKRIARWLILALLLYAVLGFLVIPLAIKTKLPTIINARLDRPATIGSAHFNPFTLHLTIKNAIIGAHIHPGVDNIDPLLSIGRLDLNFSPQSLFTNMPLISRISGNTIFFHLRRSATNKLNITDIYQRLTGKADHLPLENLLPSLAKLNINLINSRLTFSDQRNNTIHQVEEITLRLAGQGHNPYLSASVDGSLLEIGGNSGQNNGQNTAFHFSLRECNIPTLLTYIPGQPLTKISKGKADIDLTISLASTQNASSKGLTISGTGSAHDIWLTDTKSKENKVSEATFSFIYDPANATLLFDKLSLVRPEFQLVHSKVGKWYLPIISRPVALTAKTAPDTKIEITNLTLHHGTIAVIDQQVKGGFATSFTQVNLTVTPSAHKTVRKYAFNCITTRNTHIASQGTFDLHNFLDVTGLVVINNLPLAALNSYFNNSHNIDCTAGIIDKLKAQVKLSIKPDFTIKATANHINSNINNLQLNKNGQKLLKIAKITNQDAFFSNTGLLNLGNIAVTEAEAVISPATATIINLLPLRATSSSLEQNFLSLSIQNSTLYLHNFPLQPTKNYAITIKSSLIKLTSTGPNITTLLGLPGNAEVSLAGNLTLPTLAGALNVKISNYPANLLLEKALSCANPLTINQGLFNATGVIRLPKKIFQGNLAITNIEGIYDHNHVFKIPLLASSDVVIALAPLTIKMASTQVNNAEISSTLKPAPPLPLTREQNKQSPPRLIIDNLAINNGNWQIKDETLSPPFSSRLIQVNADLQNIHTSPATVIALNLKGNTSEHVTVELTGNMAPFSPQKGITIQGKINNYPLSTLNPYLQPILGNAIIGGQLSVDIFYNRQTQFIKATTHFHINNFRHQTTSPNKAKDTIMALVTDKNNNIDLNFSVESQLPEPSFTYHTALGKELRQKIMQATVAPFSLLTQFSPAGQPPADHLLFPPGSSTISPEDPTLKTIATILSARPNLQLILHGYADGEVDRQALTKAKEKIYKHQRLEQDLHSSALLSGSYGQEEIKPPPAPLSSTPIPIIGKNDLLELAQKRCLEAIKIYSEYYHLPKDQLAISPQFTIIPRQNSGNIGRRVDFSFQAKPLLTSN